MKHIPHRAIALPILFLLLTVSSVFGQSDRQTVVNVPFNFIVGEKLLPAGQYVIERNKRDSETVWAISRKETGGSRTLFMTIPVRSVKNQEQTKLVFHRYENFYFLSSIWTAGGNSGRELQLSDRERNLEDRLLAKREEIILTNRGR